MWRCVASCLPMEKTTISKNFASSPTSFWTVFCKYTGLHGWKYIVSETSLFARFFWFLTCFAALALAIGLVAWSWLDFRADPITTLPFKTQEKIGRLYFPTVTICSFNKISKRAAFKMAEKLNIKNYTSVEELAHTLKLLARLIDNKNHDLPKKEYAMLRMILKLNGLSEHQVFEKIAPSCNELLKKCKWKNQSANCSVLFQTTKSSVGFCCSSNYYGLKKLRAQIKVGNFEYFLKNPGCIFQTGLEVLLDNDPSDYFVSTIPSIGFQVLIHNAFDFPHFALPTYLSEMNTNNFISIKTENTSPSTALKAIKPSQRNCLFHSERRMKFTTWYTYQNCVSECKAATIMEICGCVPFYLLGAPGHSQIPCTIKQQKCIAMNQDTIFDINRQRPHRGKSNMKCKCYPNCLYYNFLPYLSKGPLDLTHFKNPDFIESGTNLKNFTVLRVFASSIRARANRRDVKFSNFGLLGFFAGLVGLLTAFSFITIAELVYLLGARRSSKYLKTNQQRPQRITVAALDNNPNQLQL